MGTGEPDHHLSVKVEFTAVDPEDVDDYSASLAQMRTQTDPYPGAEASLATDLPGELARLRYQLALIMGKSYWYIDPDVSLASIHTALRFSAAQVTFQGDAVLGANSLKTTGCLIKEVSSQLLGVRDHDESTYYNLRLHMLFTDYVDPPTATSDLYLRTREDSGRALYLQSYDTAFQSVIKCIGGYAELARCYLTGALDMKGQNITDSVTGGTVDGVDISELLLKTTKVGDLATIWDKSTKIDHGGDINGLGDDDHTIYLLAAGTRDLTGNLAVNAGVTIDGIDISVHDPAATGVHGVGASYLAKVANSDQVIRKADITDFAHTDAQHTSTRVAVLTPLGAILPAANAPARTKVTGTNHTYYVLEFDDTTVESCFWHFIIPDTYDGGNITAKIFWKAAAVTGDVIFDIEYAGVADSESFDPSLTNVACAALTVDPTSEDINISSCTLTTPFTAGDLVIIKLHREAGDAGDDMSGDAKVVMVKLEYTT